MPSDNPRSSVLLHRINPVSSSSPPSSSSLPKIESPLPASLSIPDAVAVYHTYTVHPSQCCSAVVQHIDSPLPVVWSFVRRFDDPTTYKHFVRSCHVISSCPAGPNSVGSLRRIEVVSGLPAANSTERLEILDDTLHVISFSVVGGDHRLANYRSVTTLQESEDGTGTVVVESYVVDVPLGNTKEETFVFVDTIVRCNLQSLAQISMNLARENNEVDDSDSDS
ncbi:hypothetical protein MLD38_029987 [Melastoma candidum]|uniref:Uncharacterized protein n=1 Tax=Melastoma candidum TaxID=119954 RepID=A0ACB9MKH0_9MYRT|nr:hypothetical protein MLD38_029987 [Melastoma candidum]